MMRLGMVAVVILAACSRERRVPIDDQGEKRVAMGDQDAAVRPDSNAARFQILVDSMNRLETRISSLGSDASAAPLLLLLGELKTRAQSWTQFRGAGFEYAKQRPAEYVYDDPDGTYLYSGSHWKQLIQRYPNDTLADDAGWALAHLTRGGECEGHTDCALNVAAKPLLDFLERFPRSNRAMAAVEEANVAFDQILGDIPDLANFDTTDMRDYVPAEVMPIVAHYDSVAARLPDSTRHEVYRYTSELWTKFGKPERRH
jgi:hypothetical protein